MQKIKSALTGHSDSSTSPTSDRTSREYTTGSREGYTGESFISGNGNPVYGRDSMTTGTTTSPTTGKGVTEDVSSTATGYNATKSASNDYTADNLRASTGTTGTGSGLTETGKAAGLSTSAVEGERGVTSSRSGALGSIGHSHGHDTSIAAKFDPTAETTTHDHKHLQHVVQRNVRHVETEEVEREREQHRVIHHVQHHVQPIIDKQVNPEVHHEKVIPVTKITEQHVNTDEDRQLFAGLGAKHKDVETHAPKERIVVDRGEKIVETVHHHVHHVTQPVIQQEVVDHHRIHTKVPLQHTIHEAPIIHKSSLHEPILLSDFKKGGGVLGSGITLDKAGVLQNGECTRTVDGIGEKLAQELHIGSNSTSSYETNKAVGSTVGTTAATTEKAL